MKQHTIEVKEVLERREKASGTHKWASTYKRLVKCTPLKTIITFELL